MSKRLKAGTAVVTADEYKLLARAAWTEKEFQSEVLALAKRYRWRSAHFRPGMLKSGKWVTAVAGDGKGWLDVVLVRHPEHPSPHPILFLELKRDTGKLTSEQQDWLDALRAAGLQAMVLRPAQWDMIERLLSGSEEVL